MTHLLEETVQRGVVAEFGVKQISDYGKLPHDEISQESQSVVNLLSDREIEVLQLVAQGLTNKEISERLYLALDTVKGHNRRIYSKLGVRKRIDAITQAREMGIL